MKDSKMTQAKIIVKRLIFVIMLTLSIIAIVFIKGGGGGSTPGDSESKQSDRISVHYCWEKYNVESNKDISSYTYGLCTQMQKKYIAKYHDEP